MGKIYDCVHPDFALIKLKIVMYLMVLMQLKAPFLLKKSAVLQLS